MSANRPVVIVGELNPYGSNPTHALHYEPRNASGNRLREHIGLSDFAYHGLKKYNLCKGKWEARRARDEAAEISRSYPDGVIVLLGVKVQTAFGGPPSLVAEERYSPVGEMKTLISLPHPSGRNPAWNDPNARRTARILLKKYAPWLPVGEVD